MKFLSQLAELDAQMMALYEQMNGRFAAFPGGSPSQKLEYDALKRRKKELTRKINRASGSYRGTAFSAGV